MDWHIIYKTILRDNGNPILRSTYDTFSIGPVSVRDLQFTINDINFICSFDGRPERVRIPLNEVLGIDDERSDNI